MHLVSCTSHSHCSEFTLVIASSPGDCWMTAKGCVPSVDQMCSGHRDFSLLITRLPSSKLALHRKITKIGPGMSHNRTTCVKMKTTHCNSCMKPWNNARPSAGSLAKRRGDREGGNRNLFTYTHILHTINI